jgi:HPt (histidine-containing phosphotransfer) domain-containing protein
MQRPVPPVPAIYSIFGDDPNLAELVRIFVSHLPQRVETLRSHAAEKDWESLARVAHQLNRFASMYGFAQLGTLAARLESCSLTTENPEEIQRALERFAAHCARVKAGSPTAAGQRQATRRVARAV